MATVNDPPQCYVCGKFYNASWAPACNCVRTWETDLVKKLQDPVYAAHFFNATRESDAERQWALQHPRMCRAGCIIDNAIERFIEVVYGIFHKSDSGDDRRED